MKKFFSKRVFFVLILVVSFVLLSFGVLSFLDNLISSNVPSMWNPFFNLFFVVFSQYIFDTKLLCLFVFVLSLVLYKRKRFSAVFLLLIVGVTAFFSEAIKYLISNPRPLEMLVSEGPYSFPSSHASISLVFFLSLFFLFKDNLKSKKSKFLVLSFFIFLILLVGFSRIYLNVHFLSDVLAGYLFGGVVFLIFSSDFIVKKIKKIGDKLKKEDGRE